MLYARLAHAYLTGANLSSANMSRADLSGANLEDADLSEADLSEADLSKADLDNAKLIDANLSGAELSYADLNEAEGVTKEMLEQHAGSLRGATMPDGTIYPGRYAASKFEPAVSFEVGEGWEFGAPETTDQVLVQTRPYGGELSCTNPLYVFDPSYLSEAKELPAPESAEEWVSWFQSHPNLDISKPVPARVGVVSGMRIDVTASSTPKNYPRDICDEQPCVPLYPLSDENILVFEGYEDRFVIVDVGGSAV